MANSVNKQITIRQNLAQLINNKPPLYLLHERSIEADKSHEKVSKKLRAVLKNLDHKIIFLIGEWGSGKTTHIKEFLKENGKEYRFKEKSFYGVSSLKDAYFSLLGNFKRVVAVLLLVIFIITAHAALIRIGHFPYLTDLLSSVPTALKIWEFYQPVLTRDFIISGGVLFLFYFFLTSKMKAFYGLTCAIRSYLLKLFFFIKRRSVIIIEDLDRSSMSEEDRWALLTGLWHHRQSYIVTYGYKSKEDKYKLIELIQKLEGHLIELDLSPSINYKIITSLYSEFPFTPSKWQGLFTPRELIEGFEKTKNEGMEDKAPVFIQARVIHHFFMELADKIGLSRNAVEAQVSCKFDHGKIQIRLPSNTEENYVARRYLNDFGTSIKYDFMMDLMKRYPAEKQTAIATWANTEIIQLLKNKPDDFFESI